LNFRAGREPGDDQVAPGLPAQSIAALASSKFFCSDNCRTQGWFSRSIGLASVGDRPCGGRRVALSGQVQSTYPLTDRHTAQRAIGARGKLALALSLVIATIAVLFWRRPDQFLLPMVWAEESTIVGEYAARGWASIAEPIQGYHILATRLITTAALQLSFAQAPHFAVWITAAFTCLVMLAVAFSPTHLRLRPLCALAVLLVPTDSEVFAVSLYAFWWAGILLLLALLWDRGLPWLRAGYIVLGGLSSPLIGPVAILLAGRAALERTRTSAVMAVLAVVLAAVQTITAYFHINNPGGFSFDLAMARSAIAHLVGFFYVGSGWLPEHRYSQVGYVMLAAFAVLIWLRRDRLDRYFLLLVLIWVGICALTMVRMPVGEIHPFLAGPRYFFYPFLLLTWAGLWIAAVSGPIIKWSLAISYVAALWFAITYEYQPGYRYLGFARRHDPIDWRAHAERCAQSEKYVMPIHTNGDANVLWPRELTGAQCRALLENSVF
jgi:hypothetical protein